MPSLETLPAELLGGIFRQDANEYMRQWRPNDTSADQVYLSYITDRMVSKTIFNAVADAFCESYTGEIDVRLWISFRRYNGDREPQPRVSVQELDGTGMIVQSHSINLTFLSQNVDFLRTDYLRKYKEILVGYLSYMTNMTSIRLNNEIEGEESRSIAADFLCQVSRRREGSWAERSSWMERNSGMMLMNEPNEQSDVLDRNMDYENTTKWYETCRLEAELLLRV